MTPLHPPDTGPQAETGPASDADFRLLVERSVDGIAVLDAGLRLRYANPRLAELAGLDLKVMLRCDLRQLLRPAPPELFFPAAAQEPHSGYVETLLAQAEGEYLPVEITQTPTSWQGEACRLLFFRDISKRKKEQEELSAYHEQLRSLAEQLSQAEERERRRIASELHDDVCQTLALSSIKLSALALEYPQPKLGSQLAAIKETLDAAIDGLRSLTLQLCPPVLYDLGLVAALEWLCRSFQQSYGLRVRFVDDTRAPLVFDQSRFTIFQMVRELLVNTVRHAQVDEALLTITCNHETFAIVVEDSGVGFDPRRAAERSPTTGGFGLFNIKQRIGFLGGECCFDAEPGRGCRSILLIPMLP